MIIVRSNSGFYKKRPAEWQTFIFALGFI